MPDEVADFYDDFAEYQLAYLVEPNARFRAIRQRLRPFLAEKPTSAIDIGCGIGVMTDWLARSIDRVVGVDISPRNIRIADALYERPEFAVCRLPEDPLPEGPFELITLLDVLEHFASNERGDVFRRIGEAATADTIVAVNLPSREFALGVPEGERQVIDEAIGVGEVVALGATLGMEPIMIDRYGIAAPNQYVFCALSRTYPFEGRVESGWRATVEARVGRLRNRLRYRKMIDRLRRL